MLRNLSSDSKLHDAALYYMPTPLCLSKSLKLRQLTFIKFFGQKKRTETEQRIEKRVDSNNISVVLITIILL